MIKIYNFQVGQADCILVHFEENIDEIEPNDDVETEKRYFNLLIDGAYKKDKIHKKLCDELDKESIQGIVVTHVDEDHISGIIGLVEKKKKMIENAFLLFNKYDESLISYDQAKKLEQQFQTKFRSNIQVKSYEMEYSQDLMSQINTDSRYISIEIRSLEQRSLAEEISQEVINITILGPTQDNIKKFMQNWHNDNKNAEITNRASIMLLIEYEGKAIILSGDGYYTDIECALSEIKDLNKINVMKAAHHGASANNDILAELVEKYDCEHIFFTIDKEKYNGKKEHPNPKLLEELKKIADERDDSKEALVLSCNSDIKGSELENYLIEKTEINI